MINKKISAADAAGFGGVAKEVEHLLTDAAGRNVLAKTRKRLNNKAKDLGVSFEPKDFAAGATAEKARKAKQDAFVKAKIEELKAAEEEAAEAAAAEAEAAAEAAAAEAEAAATAEAEAGSGTRENPQP